MDERSRGQIQGQQIGPQMACKRSIEYYCNTVDGICRLPIHTLSALDQDQQLKIRSHVCPESLTIALFRQCLPQIPSHLPSEKYYPGPTLDPAFMTRSIYIPHRLIDEPCINRLRIFLKSLFVEQKETIDLGSP